MRWTEEADDYLKKNYRVYFAWCLAEELGTTASAVRARCFRLGLTNRAFDASIPDHIIGVSSWRKQFKARFRGKYLGIYSSWREAALAYNQAVKAELGDKARLNKLD